VSDTVRVALIIGGVIAVCAMANCAARETEARYRLEYDCVRLGGKIGFWSNRCQPSVKGIRYDD
jgi:hypothetical protein